MGKLGLFGTLSVGLVGGGITANYFLSYSPIDVKKKRERELGGKVEVEPVQFPREMKTRFITKFINSLGDTHYNFFHTPLFPLLSPPTVKALASLKPLLSPEEYINLERGLSMLDDSTAVKHGVPPIYRCALSSLVRSMLHSRERVEREWRERKGEIERERERDGKELGPVVVVTGMGGSGGPFLQQLLACDDRVRHLTRWEQKDPVPFPTRQSYPFDSRREADSIWEENENMLVTHVSKYKPLLAPPPSPSGPPAFDDILLLSQGLFFPLISPPGNNFLSHFLSSDSAKAVYPYIWRFLSLSEYFNPPETFFLLCSPLHAYHLKEFSETFDHPQSLIILLHRDPIHALPPIAHQTAFHSLHLFRDLNNKNDPFLEKTQFGRAILNFMREGVDRMENGRKALKEQGKGDKIIDVEFRDLGKDPIGVVKNIYKKGGWEFHEATEKKMTEFIHQKFREVVVAGDLGGLGAWGLKEEEVDEVMAGYVRERGYGERRKEREREWERIMEEGRREEEEGRK